MIKAMFVRAAVDEVLAVVDAVLAKEGYFKTDVGLPEGMRRVVVAMRDGWVMLADDPRKMTEWAGALSVAIAEPVFTLEGECDHAFYSSVAVHRGGEKVGVSTVPEDAVLEADGRHRIRPLFLAAYFPEAREQLEAGIVVEKLGGEPNVLAVAEVLGLPNALLSSYDEEADGRTAYLYAFDAERAPPREDRVRAEIAKLAAAFAPDLAGLGVDPATFLSEMMSGFGAAAGPQPLSLEAPMSSKEAGFVGRVHRFHTTLQLSGGKEGDRARDLTIRLAGSGFALLEVASVYVMGAGGVRSELALDRSGSAIVARGPAVELVAEPDRPAFGGGAFERPSEVVVYVESLLAREGEGPLHLEATMSAGDATLEATSRNTIRISPALRIPLLPDGVPTPDSEYHLDAYAGRTFACGWLGFDRSWSEIAGAVVGIVATIGETLFEVHRSDPRPEKVVLADGASHDEIYAALDRGAEVFVRGQLTMRVTRDPTCDLRFDHYEETPGADDGLRARVLRKGGESLEFPAPIVVGDATWKKIEAELEQGADVTLELGPWNRAKRLEVSHQPEGSNHFPRPEDADRYVRVQVAWSCLRPNGDAGRAALATMATDVLRRAGAIEKNLGGVASAFGAQLQGPSFELPYERLVSALDRKREPKTFSAHVRSPGHRVLVPAAAATKLGALDGIEREALAHGHLLKSSAPDAFAYDARAAEAMERAVLPLL
ncbi:MAG: hypothetical protein KIT84_35500 [Labilithrix sp.]|nr:hypothetical protein [Labilithrix sp.]MCW5816358.1 hypothetical protein [Labilithrix sp.]